MIDTAPESAELRRGGMTLEQARRVTWVRSRPKPLGELLDEGYLDTARLEWAAKWAYNPRLKEAAQVILDWRAGRLREHAAPVRMQAALAEAEAPVRVGISLELARSTVWPFRPLRGQPMGALVDTRKLSIKDLAFAVETAWDDRVRRAAIALLLQRLDQEIEEPPPPAGPLNVVVAGRSYAEASQLRLVFAEGALLGAVLGACLVYVVAFLVRQPQATSLATTWARATASPESMIAFSLAVAFVVGLASLLWLGPN